MVDTLICFTMERRFADDYLKALQRDFYNEKNTFAVGTPFYRMEKDKALFFCPLVLPIGGAVGKIVKKTVLWGLSRAQRGQGLSSLILQRQRRRRKSMTNIKRSFLGLEVEKTKDFFIVHPYKYKIHKEAFYIVLSVIFMYSMISLILILSNERFYVKNDSPFAIENPLYNFESSLVPEYIRNMEMLPEGFEAGYMQPEVVRSADVFSLMAILLFFFVNHFKFNKNKNDE